MEGIAQEYKLLAKDCASEHSGVALTIDFDQNSTNTRAEDA
jgi:hypothetical protein